MTAEPTSELREKIAEALHYAAEDPEDAYPVAWENNYARNDLYDAADALLAGPLAPLLAKLKAVEKLADEWDRFGDRYKMTAATAAAELRYLQRHVS